MSLNINLLPRDSSGRIRVKDSAAVNFNGGTPVGSTGLLAASGLGPILDGYTANLWSAFSNNRKLVSTGGNSHTVYDTTTTTEQTFTFSGNVVNTGAILTFLNGHTGQVRVIYDQSGGGNHLQSSFPSYPRVASGGVWDGFLRFDGVDDGLQCVNLIPVVSGYTIFLRGNLRSNVSAIKMLVEMSGNFNGSNAGAFFQNDLTDLRLALHDTSPAGFSSFQHLKDPSVLTVWCMRWDYTQSSNATQTVLFQDGTKLTGINTSSGALPDGNFANTNLFIGCRILSAFFADLNLYDLVVYSAAKSDADCAAISLALAA